MTMLELIVFILTIKSIIDSIMIKRIFNRLIDLQENAILMGKIISAICKNESED